MTAAACLIGTLAVSPAAAQTRPSAELSAGVGRLHYAYRFENDSSFDTPSLVRHFFEQRYRRTGPELQARLRYRLRSRTLTTSFMFSPEVSAFGSDFDTFLQPSGDVVVSGTAGEARLAGAGIDQTISLVTRPGRMLGVVFAWRRDRADFRPADRIVTHTRPPSETRERTTDRERTVSQTFEAGVEAQFTWDGRGRDGKTGWMLRTTARVTPALRARLLVQLPDKYPGRDIVFSAAGWSAGARIEMVKRVGRASAGGWLSAGRAGSYRRAARFSRDELAAGVTVAFGDRR